MGPSRSAPGRGPLRAWLPYNLNLKSEQDSESSLRSLFKIMMITETTVTGRRPAAAPLAQRLNVRDFIWPSGPGGHRSPVPLSGDSDGHGSGAPTRTRTRMPGPIIGYSSDSVTVTVGPGPTQWAILTQCVEIQDSYRG